MKRIIPIIILLAAIGGGTWWYNRSQVAASVEPAGLVGSGSIEAETVAITAELGGRIVEIKVDEGDEVAAGQVLVELDKSELLAQQSQLAAAVATAKANLALVSAPALAEDIALAQAELAQSQVNRDGARLTWEAASDLVNDPHSLTAQINQARTRVSEAETRLEMAQVQLKRMEVQAETASRNQSNHAALVQNEAAQDRLEAARVGLEIAEVALDGANRQVEHLIAIRNRPLTLISQANAAAAALQQAEAAILAAEANLIAVEADPTPEDIAVAQAQVLEAEAALAAIEVQRAKQTLTAPRNGLVSQKLVNPGELATPGTVLLELSDIDTVDLTVYIPETRIGEVKVGQKALVYVDAFEGKAFEGRVNFIAHEAEFTPRNIQTQEERVNLVFAVKIELDNADHRLKPGMPADAEILPYFLASQPDTPTSTTAPTATLPLTATPTPVTASTSAAESLPSATTLPAVPTSKPVTVTPAIEAEVITWALNVRSGPGIDHPVTATLRQGEVVTVIDVDPETGWLHVALPSGDEIGWITDSSTFVSIR